MRVPPRLSKCFSELRTPLQYDTAVANIICLSFERSEDWLGLTLSPEIKQPVVDALLGYIGGQKRNYPMKIDRETNVLSDVVTNSEDVGFGIILEAKFGERMGIWGSLEIGLLSGDGTNGMDEIFDMVNFSGSRISLTGQHLKYEFIIGRTPDLPLESGIFIGNYDIHGTNFSGVGFSSDNPEFPVLIGLETSTERYPQTLYEALDLFVDCFLAWDDPKYLQKGINLLK